MNAYAHEIEMQRCFREGREDFRAGKQMRDDLNLWDHDERIAYRQGFYSEIDDPDACWEMET